MTFLKCTPITTAAAVQFYHFSHLKLNNLSLKVLEMLILFWEKSIHRLHSVHLPAFEERFLSFINNNFKRTNEEDARECINSKNNLSI